MEGLRARINYESLYGVPKYAEPDFYLPESRISIEIKRQMTLHQVSKMLFLAERSGTAYYVAQYSEEDWNPTIQSLITPIPEFPPSTRSTARRKANIKHQLQELLHLAAHPCDAAKVNAATAARLRAYVQLFDEHVRAACGRGLLGS